MAIDEMVFGVTPLAGDIKKKRNPGQKFNKECQRQKMTMKFSTLLLDHPEFQGGRDQDLKAERNVRDIKDGEEEE